jgi:hypothetical protein
MALNRNFRNFAPSLFLLALPCCTDQSYFPGDSGPADGSSWTYDGLGPAPDLYQNPCAPNPPPSISGKVYAPNGVDPVAGASVHVPLALAALSPSVTCESCAVKGRFLAHIYSGADGSFKLVGVPNGTFKLGIQKGHFRRLVEVTVPSCGHLDLPREKTTLPGRSRQWDPLDAVPSIAVVSGVWDQMEKVLDKLGLEERTLYNGRVYGTGTDSVQALLQNGARLQSHHLLLINCGTKFENLVTSAGPARNNLREYVRQGGRLFATDYSYDYIEQVFPELIDYEGSDATPPSQPEEWNAAERGTEITSVQGTILDASLKAWLGLPEIDALAPGGQVPLTGFMPSWAVMKSVNENAGGKVWVTAPVTWAGGAGARPLTATADYRGTDGTGCGRILFSSYHTHGTAPELLPQERILEYMILEIGACSNIE